MAVLLNDEEGDAASENVAEEETLPVPLLDTEAELLSETPPVVEADEVIVVVAVGLRVGELLGGWDPLTDSDCVQLEVVDTLTDNVKVTLPDPVVVEDADAERVGEELTVPYKEREHDGVLDWVPVPVGLTLGLPLEEAVSVLLVVTVLDLDAVRERVTESDAVCVGDPEEVGVTLAVGDGLQLVTYVG